MRDITPYVNKSDVTETDTLTTLFVVVPNFLQKEWLDKYETLTKYVLPRSTRGPMHTDAEYSLFSVVLFKRDVPNFKQEARARRFTVREFTFDESALDAARASRQQLEADEKARRAKLLQWMKASFSEVFAAWMHLKVLRAFVETVLRFGLPPVYMAALVQPKPKMHHKVRAALADLCSNVAGASLMQAELSPEEQAALAGAGGEFFPYVCVDVDVLRS